jgi:hypothetical protein
VPSIGHFRQISCQLPRGSLTIEDITACAFQKQKHSPPNADLIRAIANKTKELSPLMQTGLSDYSSRPDETTGSRKFVQWLRALKSASFWRDFLHDGLAICLYELMNDRGTNFRLRALSCLW